MYQDVLMHNVVKGQSIVLLTITIMPAGSKLFKILIGLAFLTMGMV